MKLTRLCLACGAAALCTSGMIAGAQEAHHPDDSPRITVSPGVELQELTGLSAAAGAKTGRSSVALFHLGAGRASAWSFTRVGEESFFILEGHGEVWVGNHASAVKPGSYILVPPGAVRSVRASRGEPLVFYAITTPAWTSGDDVLTAAPEGAPH